MTRKIILLMIIVLFSSCENKYKNELLKSSKWLIGSWENITDHGKLLEIWKKDNDSIYVAESFYIRGSDTLHSEKIQLKQKADHLFYISTIKGQNGNKPITFDHKIEVQKQLVFENPHNDYPKQIIYKRLSKDRLLIEISGIQNGKESVVRYSMKKTK